MVRSLANTEMSLDVHGSDTAWRWPVRWQAAAKAAALYGRSADALLDEPNLAAHRLLEHLAAFAIDTRLDAAQGDARLADAIEALLHAAPWLLETAPTPAKEKPAPRNAPEAPAFVARMHEAIDERGVGSLIIAARRACGSRGVRAVIGLANTALAAEQWLPAFGKECDAALHADLARLGGATAADAPLQAGLWQRLNARARTTAESGIGQQARCFELFAELTFGAEQERPAPSGALIWSTGIERVEVVDPCGEAPRLTIHGRSFGASAPAGVGVVAPTWDELSGERMYRPVPVLEWSDTRVVAQLHAAHVAGVAAFVNKAFLAEDAAWNRRFSDTIAETMRRGRCPGFGGPSPPLLWDPPSLTPPPTPAAEYTTGAPQIHVELVRNPAGTALPFWAGASVHLMGGEPMRIVWRCANAERGLLRPVNATATQMLLAAGQAPGGVDGTRGDVPLVAPAVASVAEFVIEATNSSCAKSISVHAVVTGAAFGTPSITVLQSLPGGDVAVTGSGSSEALSGGGVRSIPLVAGKRSVVRIDWWPALPQVPAGQEPIRALAQLHLHGHDQGTFGITLRPGESTADEPAVSSAERLSGPPFESSAAYQQWIDAGNEPATFNVVIPAEFCRGEVLLEAEITAFTPGRQWTVSSARWVTFHHRRRVRLRYRPWGFTVNLPPGQAAQPAPTDAQCETAIREGCRLLPFADPEIVRVPGAPGDAGTSSTLVEDLHALRPSVGSDEIWFVVGPVGTGGVAVGWAPWTGAAEATPVVVAHEIAHMFSQNHLNLCGATDGDPPQSIQDNGAVLVSGWNLRNNAPVRGATDLMADLCRTTGRRVWMSPERWRRIFLAVGR